MGGGDNTAPATGCDGCPPVEGYKNREEITHNGKSYILYDNTWIQIETPDEYNTKIENRGYQRRPPMPRGGGEISKYMRKKALPNMAEGIVTGSGGGVITDLVRALKPSLAGAIIGALLGGTYNGYKTYYDTSKKMEIHDYNVKK